MDEALPVWQGFLRFVAWSNDRHSAGTPAKFEVRPTTQGKLHSCWHVFVICPRRGKPRMKSNLGRMMFVVAIACVSLVLMESQADAFFGRFRNRGCCGQRQHWSSCNTGCASSCAPVSSCSSCAVEQVDCGCASNRGCASSCDSGCGNRRHCGIFGRRHHRRGCGGCDSGCGSCSSGCDSGCGGCQSGCDGGEVIVQEQEVESAPTEVGEAPAAPEEPADAPAEEAPAEEAPADGSV